MPRIPTLSQSILPGVVILSDLFYGTWWTFPFLAWSKHMPASIATNPHHGVLDVTGMLPFDLML
jgi:hypothetical protein